MQRRIWERQRVGIESPDTREGGALGWPRGRLRRPPLRRPWRPLQWNSPHDQVLQAAPLGNFEHVDALDAFGRTALSYAAERGLKHHVPPSPRLSSPQALPGWGVYSAWGQPCL